ncbi:ankyrin repeat-containing protein [Aspergillus nomiae NRRL 13137]|uniref:Ankyrin repeat-containing protein n=1 Tax=Aspergillus nomiae NRRL (strain ATCC 15546 / NRRL 13137 / CBS 260.88 / M93) TaxID=1509407 RepID=A0A0L1IZ51_ASPN3|nr:ankyrin repeat-containing protein [Aspergillus nomiae NRRL 13137]KNG84794.1 ankyrin repeat-containing protein [Aspergillus nomiae NRRL 13137]
MAPTPEDAVFAISAQATQLGNRISVRMLDYLSTVHDIPDGFGDLSKVFLDTCRSLWTIEAGLSESTTANRPLPRIIIQEVEKKFTDAYREFQHLDRVVTRLIQYEHRGALGRLQRGWNRPSHELGKIRESLKSTTEALQISVLAFHWSLGDAKPEESVGVGYAGLAAALDRMAKGRSVAGINKAKTLERGIAEMKQPSQAVKVAPAGPPPSVPVPPVPPKPSFTKDDVSRDHGLGSPGGTLVDSMPETMSSVLSLDSLSLSSSQHGRDLELSQARTRTTNSIRDDHPHLQSPSASTLAQEIETNASSVLPSKASYRKHDLPRMPQRTPSNTSAANVGHLKNALASAVRARNHQLMEQLLDSGVSPDMGENTHPLNEAILHRDIEGMRLLLAFGASPDAPDQEGKSPLFSAVEGSFMDGATLLLKYRADPCLMAGSELESPLGLCITSLKTGLVHVLLAHGANPNHEMRNGSTVLIEAIRRKAPQRLVDLLLDAGADANLKNREGKSALFEAVQTDQVTVVTTLLDHGANPNLPGPEHVLWSAIYRPACLRILMARGADVRKTPGIMEQATGINNIDSVRVLLQTGVDPNSKKDGIYTPLCSAIRDDRGDIFALLLANGANPNVMASEYPAWKCVTHFRTHLLPDLVDAGADLHQPPGIVEMAVQVNNGEAVQWLLEHGGANPNDRNSQGHTALTTAIRDNRVDLLTLLLAHGADPNQRGQDWPVCMAVRSPTLLQQILPSVTDLSAHKGVMEMAVLANQLESIKLLLAAGASVEYKNGGVFSPLTTALREGHEDIVRFLLNEAGADPNAPGEHLPIVKAVRRCHDGDFKMIELLLEKGADPNITYREWNAVMEAIENRDLRLLQLLAEKGGGVDLEKQDETGKTVMQMVDASGWSEATQLLLDNARR